MAAKSWQADFRYPAIQASIELIRTGYLGNPFDCPRSFCIPVAKRPAIGWTPGKITLIFLILGFAGLFAGAWIASIAEKQVPANVVLLVVAVSCSLSGFVAFIIPVKCDRWILSRLMGVRGREFYERAGLSQILCGQISSAAASQQKLSVDADDYVLIGFDDDNRRILIEGTAARYLIRAEDVELIAPFEWMNHIGVEVKWRIDDNVDLHLAVARPSLLMETIRQVPVLFFLKRFIPRKLYQRFAEVLYHDDLSWGNGLPRKSRRDDL